MALVLAPVGGGLAHSRVSLPSLIHLAVQSTYHELNILSKLLPDKSDMDRKIAIIDFSRNSRMLFIRLLAVIKWANNASKVEKCTAILEFLETQNDRFINTADTFAKLAREDLMSARLPMFSLVPAIDVLTTGTYPRLPKCIQDKILKPASIAGRERKKVLTDLNRIIEYRLSRSELPHQMRNLKIENGRVKFTVVHEFEAVLTMMGEDPQLPWRLLEIDILIKDPVLSDGRSLVHPAQMLYLHDLIQGRLLSCASPIEEVYNILQTFCYSLKLEVLHSQAQRLVQQRGGDSVKIEQYSPGKLLTIMYWCSSIQYQEAKPIQYRICLSVPAETGSRRCHTSLQVSHIPSLETDILTSAVWLPPSAKRLKTNDVYIDGANLSISQLLSSTVETRIRHKLSILQEQLKASTVFSLPAGTNYEVLGTPPSLWFPLLDDSSDQELFRVSINLHTGLPLVSCEILKGNGEKHVKELEKYLKVFTGDLAKTISDLRLALSVARLRCSLIHTACECQDRLPITNLSKHRLGILMKEYTLLFIKIPRQYRFYLVVTISITGSAVHYQYYLLHTLPSTHDGQVLSKGGGDVPSLFSSAGFMAQLNPSAFVAEDTIDQCIVRTKMEVGVSLFDMVKAARENNTGRKYSEHRFKRPLFQSTSSSSVYGSITRASTVVDMINCLQQRIPFITLAEVFEDSGIDKGTLAFAPDNSPYLYFQSIPKLPGIDDALREEINALSPHAILRPAVNTRTNVRGYFIELSFFKNPFAPFLTKPGPLISRVCRSQTLSKLDDNLKTVNHYSELCISVCKLYRFVRPFLDYLQEEKPVDPLHLNNVSVDSFTFDRLLLCYGPNKQYTVSVVWNHVESQFGVEFGRVKIMSPIITLGSLLAGSSYFIPGKSTNSRNLFIGTSADSGLSTNPHSILLPKIIHFLNEQNGSIYNLIRILNCTASLVECLYNLSAIPSSTLALPSVSFSHQRMVSEFTVVPQGCAVFMLLFRNTFCIEIRCMPTGLVVLRDLGYSRPTFSSVFGLKAFLNRFMSQLSALKSVSTLPVRLKPTTASVPKDLPVATETSTALKQESLLADGVSKDTSAIEEQKIEPALASLVESSSEANSEANKQFLTSAPTTTSISLTIPSSSSSAVTVPITPSPVSTFITPSPAPPSVSMPVTSPLTYPSLMTPEAPLFTSSSVLPSPSPAAISMATSLEPSPDATNRETTTSLHNVTSPSAAVKSEPGSFQNTDSQDSCLGTEKNQAMEVKFGDESLLKPTGNTLACQKPSFGRPYPKPDVLRFLTEQRPPFEQAWHAGISVKLPITVLKNVCAEQFDSYSPLHRLCCLGVLLKQLKMSINVEETLTLCPTILPLKDERYSGSEVSFRTLFGYQFCVAIYPTVFQSGIIDVLKLEEESLPQQQDGLSFDDLNVLKAYFSRKLVVPPYRPQNIHFLTNLLSVKSLPVLKAAIQLMRIEMDSSASLTPGSRWQLELCTTVPPGCPFISPQTYGSSGFMHKMSKILLIIKLTARTPPLPHQGAPYKHPATLIIPLAHDMENNSTAFMDRPDQRQSFYAENPHYDNVCRYLKELNTMQHASVTSCSIIPVIGTFIHNFVM